GGPRRLVRWRGAPAGQHPAPEWRLRALLPLRRRPPRAFLLSPAARREIRRFERGSSGRRKSLRTRRKSRRGRDPAAKPVERWLPSASPPFQEVGEQLLSFRSEDGFGMELHSYGGMGGVRERHDFAVVLRHCGDAQVAGQGLPLDDQGVVAAGLQRSSDAAEDPAPIVSDLRGLAVHHPFGPHHASPEGLADRLMPQANAENWNLPGKLANGRHAHPRLARRAWPGGKNERIGTPGSYSLHVDPIVAEDFDRRAQLPQILNQVEGEGVVVVDDEDPLSHL